MLTRKEKMLLHIYKNAACLDNAAYRGILKGATGCVSASDLSFSQSDFESAMAAIETRLFQRVNSGAVPDPIEAGNRWIRSEYYWRNKLPPAGKINSRQADLIRRIWADLGPYMPEENRTPIYLAGIVRKATGKADIGITALTSAEAWHVIEALKDRLGYAVRGENNRRSVA